MKPPHGIEELPNGQWIVAGDTHLGAWAKQKGNIVTDPNLLRFLDSVIPPNSVVWDIGANIGDHTRHYLDRGHRVVAFEPHPLAFQCLSHNCPEAQLHNLAASHSDGSLTFTSLDNIGASRVHEDGSLVVPARALREMTDLPTPDFIKLDVEGWEPFALMGMAPILTAHRPKLFVEFNEGALQGNEWTGPRLFELIVSFGYKLDGLYPAKARWGDPQFDMLFV